MDSWSTLAFKRHDQFQETLKINSKIDLVSDGFDKKQNLDYYEKSFYSSNLNSKRKNINEDEQKAKEEKERKAKEEKARKVKEQKAKEEKERTAKEQKAKEEKERKAKEQKAKEEKERKAKEQKAKEEKEKKVKEDAQTSGEELSVDDLMSKIKELNEMYKSGVISKEEFEMLKGKLLKK